MIISSVENEQAPSMGDWSMQSMTLEQAIERVRQRAGFGPGLGDKAKDVVEAYAKAFPRRKPSRRARERRQWADAVRAAGGAWDERSDGHRDGPLLSEP